jgi:hypothetical protein
MRHKGQMWTADSTRQHMLTRQCRTRQKAHWASQFDERNTIKVNHSNVYCQALQGPFSSSLFVISDHTQNAQVQRPAQGQPGASRPHLHNQNTPLTFLQLLLHALHDVLPDRFMKPLSVYLQGGGPHAEHPIWTTHSRRYVLVTLQAV